MSTLTTLNKPMRICVNSIGNVLWLRLHKEHEERVTMNVTKNICMSTCAIHKNSRSFIYLIYV